MISGDPDWQLISTEKAVSMWNDLQEEMPLFLILYQLQIWHIVSCIMTHCRIICDLMEWVDLWQVMLNAVNCELSHFFGKNEEISEAAEGPWCGCTSH